MQEVVGYVYRLRPGVAAEKALLDEWGRCRFLWNEAVHMQRSGQRPTRCRLGRLLTETRRRNAWLRAGWQNAQATILCNYAEALDYSYKVKGRRRPTVKKRKAALPSLKLTRNGFAVVGGRLRLPKGVTIPVVWSRNLPSEPTSVRVYRDSLGHWYASFVVRVTASPPSPVNGAVGIDWGITTTATASDARYDLPYGGQRKRCAAELAKAHRKMSRRRRPRGQSPSKGYCRARHQAARLQKRALRQNQHAARVWARQVVAENQTIAIENLRLLFLRKTTLARKAADGAIGTAKRELIQCAERAGRKVVLVEPAYTTMTCSQCGTRAKERLGLGQRVFRCDACGLVLDRDRNAARVILARAERNPAGADDVRHDPGPPLAGIGVVRSEPGIA